MKEMLNRVKKHNRKSIKFQQSVVIFICYYTCYLFLLYDILGKFRIVGGIGVGIMALDVGRYFIEQYLQIDKPIVGTTELYELMRYHAFDENSYFSEIKKNMKLPAGVLGVFTVGLAVIRNFFPGDEAGQNIWSIVVAVLCVGCFYGAYWIKRGLFHYQIEKGTDGKLGVVLKWLGGYVVVFEVILVFCLIIPILLLGLAASECMSPAMDVSKVVFRTSNQAFGCFCMIGFVFLLLGTLELGKDAKFKKGRIVMGICTTIMLVVGMGFIVYAANVYTEFRGNQFVVYHFGEKARYEVEDVESFCIYSDSDEGDFQLKIEFKDGQSHEILKASQTNNSLYEESYDSEIQFIADYIEVLQNAGVEGTLKHKEKIDAYIQDFDEAPDKEGWNKIQELMK